MNNLCTFAFLFISGLLTAQVFTYQTIIPGSPTCFFSGVLETDYAYYHIGGSTANEVGGDLLIYKSDKAGTPIWAKTYGTTGYSESGNIIQNVAGNLVICGGSVDALSQNNKAFIFEIDTMGNLLWSHEYGGTSHDELGPIFQTSDGGYMTFGNTSSLTVGGDLVMMKIDATGNVLWDKCYGGTYHHTTYEVVKSPDGAYMVYGMYHDNQNPLLELTKIDSVGNVLWNKRYDPPSLLTNIGSISSVSTGGYLMTGSDSIWGFVLRVDENGNEIWNKMYEYSFFVGIWDAHEVNGQFVFAGNCYRTASNSEITFFAMVTDTMGWPFWTMQYGGTSNNQGGGILPTSDGGFMLPAISWDFMIGTHAYIVKTDALGVSGCNENPVSFNVSYTTFLSSSYSLDDTTGFPDTSWTPIVAMHPGYLNLCGVGIEETYSLNAEVYPNPVSGELNPQLNSTEALRVEVYAVDGSLISDKVIQPGGTITIPTQAGMYLIRLYSNEKLFSTERIIRTE